MRRLIILIIFIGLLFQSYSQNLSIDSINIKLKELGSSRAKCEYLLDLSDLVQRPAKDFIPYILLAVDLARESGDLKMFAHALKQAGYIYYYNAFHLDAMIYFEKAIMVYTEVKDYHQMINCYNMLANLHFFRGEYDKAIIANKKILELSQKTEDRYKAVTALRQIGTNFLMLDKPDSAYASLVKAIELNRLYQDSLGDAYNYSDLGFYYRKKGNLRQAINSQLKALTFCSDKLRFLHSKALIYNRLTECYLDAGNLDSAEFYVKKALKNDRILKARIVSTYLAAKINFYRRKYSKAIAFLHEAEALAVKMRNFYRLTEIYKLYMDIYKSTGEVDKFYFYTRMGYKNFDSIKKEILNVQFSNILIYENLEKFKDVLKKLLIKEQEKQRIIMRYKRLVTVFFILVLFIVGILLQKIIYARRLEIKNRIIRRQNYEILKQAQELSKQKENLEKQNLLIEESLRCAFSIQQTILPPEKLMKQIFSEYYLIFRPMYIVSGDFYWMAELSNNISFVVLADGTGHGVPGAFISIITQRLLEHFVFYRKIFDPGKILEQLKLEFDKLIENSRTFMLTLGVEIIILKFESKNEDNLLLSFSSARMPFAYYTPGGKLKVEVIRGKSIGGLFGNKDVLFETETLLLSKETIFYLFSDGYKDQICKGDNRRINSKKFFNLLDKIKDYPITKQGKILEDYLDKCKQDIEQRDDITVLIFKMR